MLWTSYNRLPCNRPHAGRDPLSEDDTERGTNEVLFAYGPDRQRYKEQHYKSGALQSTRLTVNGYFERVVEGSNTTDKHYIRAGVNVIAIHDRKQGYVHVTHYLHRDHLGSVDVITTKTVP